MGIHALLSASSSHRWLACPPSARLCENYEIQYFSAKKYDLIKNQPFLYYVFRRRAENANVRILFVCLLAGMRDSEIKKRLR